MSAKLVQSFRKQLLAGGARTRGRVLREGAEVVLASREGYVSEDAIGETGAQAGRGSRISVGVSTSTARGIFEAR